MDDGQWKSYFKGTIRRGTGWTYMKWCKGCRALSGRRSGRLAAISIAALFADLRAASNVGSMGAPKSYGSVDVGLDEGSTDIVCWR